MIQINLLPHREEKRRLRKQAFFAGVGASVVAGAALVLLAFLVQQQRIATQEERNLYLTNANTALDAQIKDVAELRAEIDSLKARQKAVEDLQTDRNMPVYLLNELSRQAPEGLYIKSMLQSGQSVLIAGVAQSNERVSEFLRNTGKGSPWFERPELVEVKAAQITFADTKKTARLYEFSMRLNLKRPQETAPVPGAKPAAGKGAAAAPVKSASGAAAASSAP